MTTQERENAHVNEQLRRMALARDLADEFTPHVLDHLSEQVQDLFETEHAPAIQEDHEGQIRDLEAEHEEQIEEKVEEAIGQKLRFYRQRIAQLERAAETAWRTKAKARLWELHALAGEPLKLTAAQKRSEVWALRQELKAALEHAIGAESEDESQPANVVPIHAR